MKSLSRCDETSMSWSNQNGNINGAPYDTNELHPVYGEVHAPPHPIPAHSDFPSYVTANGHQNGIDSKMDPDSGAFIAAGTAGNAGFDLRSLGLTEHELYSAGLHPSNFDPLTAQGKQLPLNQYKINYDPNPIVIKKQIPIEQPTYKQQIIVRYLRPPTPPPPGPLVIKEVRPPQPAPAPPLIIRTRAPRGKTPPPIIIREQPPIAPQVDTQTRYLTKMLSNEQPPLQPYTYEQQQPQQMYNSNGYASNGYASNGYAGNGYASNGYANNGYESNGYASNEYAGNGYAGNGYASNGYTSNGYQTASDPSYPSGNFDNLLLGGNQLNDSVKYGDINSKNWITEVVGGRGERNPIPQSLLGKE
ncbi:unnamed protein product [Didymodactylos carnosus]|uniref:Uncharacterized protein n=1 Tax=Didymodactylos carnosus TaxID=1234261 RepID=A0A813TP82_9BILA|nr:unnamed protein product [Didymodactylos carnosus]CAF0812477.1 unnamed protein product [Didymodactylos carnosus]CAF3500156.1 unnamed protein product [Didymodactylos carnosus]CAF3598221.1 unnamed protein product [Didymodactylos carnosus]